MNYCKYKGLSFNIPRYKRVDKILYVPLERDIEALIASLPGKLSIFTRVFKETELDLKRYGLSIGKT